MMTLEEIGALQIGDKIQLPNGVEATVTTVNQSNQLIALDMPGGSTTLIPGDIPPERVDAPTTVICAWADLINATKVPPV
jgi:hypothetical protein